MSRRNVPPAPELPEPERDGWVTEQRVFRFCTPVFGGGVVHPEDKDDGRRPIDPVTPVRVSSIRGQLRFWWRAVNPRGCRTADDLRAAEAEVFGDAGTKSALRLAVSGDDPAKPLAGPKAVTVLQGSFGARPGMQDIAYGAFPLRGGQERLHGVLHDFGARSFRIHTTYPAAVTTDVEAAFWAFGAFGGLGARTRRGFGAIDAQDPSALSLDEGWRQFVTGHPVVWPYLPPYGERKIKLGGRRHSSGIDAQKQLLGALRLLRQGVGLGRAAGQGQRPGRSYWPEADAIRRATGKHSRGHEPRNTSPDAFPRAAFGLPIIFHFKDRRQGDPQESTLNPQGEERWASPLLLRPYRNPDGESFHALAVVLESNHGALELDKGAKRVVATVTQSQASEMQRPPQGDTRMFHDPIGAYLERIQ